MSRPIRVGFSKADYEILRSYKGGPTLGDSAAEVTRIALATQKTEMSVRFALYRLGQNAIERSESRDIEVQELKLAFVNYTKWKGKKELSTLLGVISDMIRGY